LTISQTQKDLANDEVKFEDSYYYKRCAGT